MVVANGFVRKASADLSVALGPSDLSAVAGLVQGISALGDAASGGDEKARLALVEKARSLVRALETPRETMIKHLWAQPAATAALTLGVDTGLFTALAANGGSSKKVEDLSRLVGVDAPMLGRLMRHMGAMGYIEETGPDEYAPTSFSSALTIPIIGDGYPCISGGLVASLSKLPEYAARTDYKTPETAGAGPLQYAYGTELNMFGHLQAHPPYGEQFNYHMGGYRQGRPGWMDAGFYPVRERLVEGLKRGDPEAVLLVDIGGNVGHDLDEFRRKHPDVPGRLVLQDLPVVLGQISELHPRIERVAYDFYTEQPVRGARAYYLHSVLHDWPDADCLRILGRVREAMQPGYSRLLINENVIPQRGALWEATALDVLMMAFFSSRERTEAEWRRLAEGVAGLRVVDIYTAANGVESIIECEVVEESEVVKVEGSEEVEVAAGEVAEEATEQ